MAIALANGQHVMDKSQYRRPGMLVSQLLRSSPMQPCLAGSSFAG